LILPKENHRFDERGWFDAATDYVRVGVKRWMPGLSYDLKFDKAKAKTIKYS
jgi:hypothetical protein